VGVRLAVIVRVFRPVGVLVELHVLRIVRVRVLVIVVGVFVRMCRPVGMIVRMEMGGGRVAEIAHAAGSSANLSRES
jgi:hypothetical protein